MNRTLNRRGAALLIALALIFAMATTVAQQFSRPTAAHAAGTLRRPIDSSHPLLLMQLVMGYNIGFNTDFRDDNNKHWDVDAAWQAIPDDVKPYVAFVLHPGHNSFLTVANDRKWVEDNLAEGASLGVPMLVLWGETPTTGSDNFTWIQHLYETYPNFIGTEVSELTSVSGDIPQLLALANEYGGYHVQDSLEENDIVGGKLENATYYNEVTADAANFIYSPKVFHKNYDFQNSQALGDWLSGVSGNWGPYFDAYAYYGCGIQGESSNGGGDRCSRSYPEEIMGQTMMDEYMQGATVYTFESQTDTPAVGDLYTPLFWQSILPAFRYIIAHPSPSKATVIANTKVAFSEASGDMFTLPDTDLSSEAGGDIRPTFFEGLDENVPDVENTQGLWYYPRASGRYYAIPILPKLASSATVAEFPNVITATSYKASMQGQTAKMTYFNSRYPLKYTGDAFVQNVGNQWLIYNNHYSSSTDETAQIPLSTTEFQELDLDDLTPDSYVMADTSATSLHILTDDYITDRSQDLLKPAGNRAMEFEEAFDQYAYAPHPQDTTMRTNTIQVHATIQPTLTISGYDGHYSYTQAWNAATHVYTLTLQSDAAVDITLASAPGDGTGWTQADDAAGHISYTGAWSSTAGTASDLDGTAHSTSTSGSAATYSFSGTSIEWVGDTSVGGGTASVAVDGTTLESGISTASTTAQSGQVLFKATGLTNTTHTIKITAGGGLIDLDRFSFVASQIWMLNTVDTQDFSYGDQVDDQSFIQGDDGWVVKNGVMELLPYVKPWFSDLSVYNTTASYTNFTYSATFKTLKGTPGGLLFRANAQNKTGYYLMVDPTKSNPNGDTSTAEVKLYKNGTTLLASSGTLTLAINTNYTVSVTANGSAITASINGTQVLSATDATYTSGETGVRVESNTGGTGDLVDIDNALVTVSGATAYSSNFSSWATASTWITEGALVFSPLPTRTTFDFPWEWATTGGTWSVINNDTLFTSGRNGVYQGVAAAGAEDDSSAGATTWSNYLNRTLLQFVSGSTPQAGLLFRVQDSNDKYQVLADAGAGRISLRKDVAGTWTTITSGAAFAFTTGKWYELGVQAIGDEITVTVNGTQLFSVRDGTFASGAVGYSVANGTTAQFDDDWVAQLPVATAGTIAASNYPWPTTGTTAKTLSGFRPVYVKTAKDLAPTLPTTVTELFTDGSTGSVAVSWPTATPTQLATSTTPVAGGQNQGKFSLNGTVAGTTLKPVANITVMPKLSAAFTTTVSTTVGATDFMPWSFASVQFTTGTSTFTRTMFVNWDTIPSTAAAGTFTVSGTIEDYPYAKATATVTVS